MHRSSLWLFAAAAAVSFTGPAVAHETRPSSENGYPCPTPAVIYEYGDETFAIRASLKASGCPSRYDRQFTMSAFISRVDDAGGEGHGRAITCGPFRPSTDAENGRSYSCEIDLAVDHPRVEAAHYEVEVTYPGAHGEETFGFAMFCRTDDEWAGCEQYRTS